MSPAVIPKCVCLIAMLGLLGAVGCDNADPRDASGTSMSPSGTPESKPNSADTTGDKSTSTHDPNQYEGELTRIETAKAEPKPSRQNEEQKIRDELRNSKKVKLGHGYVYVPRHRKTLKRTATAAVKGCDSRTYGSRGERKRIPIPQPPGVTAMRIRPDRVLVTYRIGAGNEACRATWLDLRADVSRDLYGPIGTQYPIKESSGQVTLRLDPHVADADVLHASVWTRYLAGQVSRTTTIRIR
jgi:hypothetical protein